MRMSRMKRSAILVAVVSTLILGAAVATAATVTNLTVTPSTPVVFDSNNVVGVANDAAPGFDYGSFASNGVAKTDMYFTPEALFARDVTLGEVESMSYWTKKGTTHAVSPADWFMAIYTKPYAGDVSTATWYGDRIGAEPYFSANLNDPANTWNRWSTDGSDNTLRFFESTLGYFGGYGDPDWATFVSGNALSGGAYAGHEVLSFSLQTGSAWAAGFTGQVDGFTVELTDGSVATVNFEPYVVATGSEDCKQDGWKTLFRADGSGFKNQGDCIQYVKAGK